MLLVAALFFSQSMPLDMPRAEAYQITTSSGIVRLEDRYNELDLWTSRAVLGRWLDAQGRVFTVSKIHESPPAKSQDTMTRQKYVANVAVPVDKKEYGVIDKAVSLLTPLSLPEETSFPRMPVCGIKDVRYYHGTNTTSVVAAFLPEEHPFWYVAVWDLSQGDEFAVALETFEEKFLANWSDIVKKDLRSEVKAKNEKPKRIKKLNREALIEKDLLRADAQGSVTNYPSWRITHSSEFAILDNLSQSGTFISTLTNELAVMRQKYASVLPSPIDGTNVLALARIFSTRSQYLDALEINDVEGMTWSAAYWSPMRRELVAYLPDGGASELLRTVKHEAFHQYFSYACSMVPSSPWINEGYAQYFEDEANSDWGIFVDLEALTEVLPLLLKMDYEQFYSGSDAERRVKYRLAWSIAYFLENGASRVPREPFKNIKRDYIASLLKNRDMHKATQDAFSTEENLKRFIKEWKKFWMGM